MNDIVTVSREPDDIVTNPMLLFLLQLCEMHRFE